MDRRQTQGFVIAQEQLRSLTLRYIFSFGLLIAVWVLTAFVAAADEKITKSHGISAFGDLKYGPEFQFFEYVNPEAPKGGEFSTWAFGTFDSMTPYILKGTAASLSSVFFESLMSGSADEPDSMYGLLAESIEYPENRGWAVFNLRPEARFSDGSPVTSEDVVFSFNVLMEKGRPSFKVTFADFENVEALNPLRVKFTFREGANTRELPIAAAGLPVFSKAYYADRDFAESTLDPPVGSGEYVLDRVRPGESVSYVRRDDYWGKDLPINRGRSNFERITIEYYSDYTAAFEGFKGGAYNFREEYLSKLWATSYNFPSLDKGWTIKKTLPDGNPSGTQGFWLNMRRDKFRDVRVREALGLMFNFEWSNKALFYDLYTRTDSFWENSDLQATGIPGEDELALLEPLREHLPDSVFAEPAWLPDVSKPKQLDRKAVRKAGKLLDAAGWKVVDGMRKNDKGETLRVEFLNDSPSFERISNPFIENLKRLGVDAYLSNVDSAQANERQKNYDYDIVVQRFVMSLTPGLELRGIFGSDVVDTPGANNLSGLANPAIDALIGTIEKAGTRQELNTAVRALDRSLRAMHIWIPQWYKAAHNVAYLDIYEHPKKLPPFAMGEVDFWWYNAEKAEKLKALGAF
ncbi:MAG: ABC transporter substrate-binding protein [Rhodobacteraceae bacterium]|nr:ABC transporter substrate-binding protein [Paracoccaceae bacterium]